MIKKSLICCVLICFTLMGHSLSAWAQGASVKAKQWPAGYFFKYKKISLKEKEQILAKIDATLKKLNQEGYGLIVKGTVIDPLRPDQKIYQTLTVLDDSGLIIMVHQVPNIYYNYYGPPGNMNKHIFLVAKNVKLKQNESYIRYGFVVEGDYLAFSQKYLKAIMKWGENVAGGEYLE